MGGSGSIRWHWALSSTLVAAICAGGCGSKSGLSGPSPAEPEVGTDAGPHECPAPEPVVLAANQYSLFRLALDATRVYWGTDASVMAVDKCGGVPGTLVAEPLGAQGVSVSGSFVYWSQQVCGGEVRRAALDGSSPTTIVPGAAGPCVQPGSVVAVDDEVYWWQSDYTVRAALADGRSPRIVVAEQAIDAVAVDDETVFFVRVLDPVSLTYEIARVPREGGEPISLAPAPDVVYGLAVDESNVYWTVRSGTVQRVAKDGGDALTLWWGGRGFPIGIDVAEGRAFFTLQDAGQLISVPKDGGDATILARGQNTPEYVAADDSGVYWVSYGNRTVMRLSL